MKAHAIHLRISHTLSDPGGPATTAPEPPESYLSYPTKSWPHKNHGRLLEAFAASDDP